MHDQHNNIKALRALGPVAMATTAGLAGKVLDRQGYGGVEFLISYGSVTSTNATITPVVMEGDATGSMTSVADSNLLGTEALAKLPAQASSRTSGVGKFVTTRVGYRGTKRYVSCGIAALTVTAATVISIAAIMHSPAVVPTANP